MQSVFQPEPACTASGSGQWLSASLRLFNRLEWDGVTMCQKYSGAKASCPCSRVRAAYFAHKNIVLPRCWGEESIKCFKRLKKGRKEGLHHGPWDWTVPGAPRDHGCVGLPLSRPVFGPDLWPFPFLMLLKLDPLRDAYKILREVFSPALSHSRENQPFWAEGEHKI